MEAIVEEKLCFDSGGLSLAGVLAYPEAHTPQRAVLLCSPHPHFAGDMDNNIILALAQDLATDSITLRFDYRGVGESAIQLPSGQSTFDYWETVEQARNYSDAMTDVAAAAMELKAAANGLSLIMVGYSFGAVVALRYGLNQQGIEKVIGISPPWTRIDFSFLQECSSPALLLTGKNDFLYSTDEVDCLHNIVSSNVLIQVLTEGDHFFRGDENHIVRYVRDFIGMTTNI